MNSKFFKTSNAKSGPRETITISSPDEPLTAKSYDGHEFTTTPKSSRRKQVRPAPLRNAVRFQPRFITATNTEEILNSAGSRICIHPLWHMELNPLKHVFLQRNPEGDLELHLKDFTKNEDRNTIYVENGLRLDIQQCRDLMFTLLQVRPTVLRNEDYKVNNLFVFYYIMFF